MPILVDQQSRLVPIGEIRIGVKVLNKAKDGSLPSKLDTFRFTSRLRHLLEQIAAKYGGEVRPWVTLDKNGVERPRVGEFEVITTSNCIKAVISIKPMANGDLESFEQWLILRNKEGKQLRKCDGENCTIWQGKERAIVACPCAQSGERLCKPNTRLRVFMPDAPDVGTWNLSTNSAVFNGEMNGFISAARSLLNGGYLVPVLLTLTKRYKDNGPDATAGSFPVVLITIDPEGVNMQQALGAMQDKLYSLPERLGEIPVLQPIAIEATASVPAGGTVIADNPKETAALEYLAKTDIKIPDFKTWCESNNMTWFNAALGAQAAGCDTGQKVFEYLEAKLQEAAK